MGRRPRSRFSVAAAVCTCLLLIGGLARAFHGLSGNDAAQFDLQARVLDEVLVISWDSSSEAIGNAQSGSVEISSQAGSISFELNEEELGKGEVLQPYQSGAIDISLTVLSPDGKPLKNSLTFLEIRPPQRPPRDHVAESERLRKRLDEQVTRNRRLEALVDVLRRRGRE